MRSSRFEYDRLIAEWLASGRSSSYGAPRHCLSIAEMLVDYLAHLAKLHGKDSVGEYPQSVRAVRPLLDLYGRIPAADFGVLQYKAVRERVGATPGRSRKYVNELMRRIVASFKWAASEGLRAYPNTETAKGVVP